MKCIILAAGYATRLYPLTKNFPKPLLKVGNKTILDWLIDDVSNCKQIDEYVVISNHKFYDHFVEWKNSRKEKIVVLDDNTSSNETRLGAVRDIQFAIEKLNLNDDLFILAGDNLTDFSFTHFTDYFFKKNASVIMRYFEKEKSVLQKCGVMKIDQTDKVLELVEKPKEPASNWGCPPFYIYHKKDIPLVKKGIESGCGVDAPGSFIAWLCEKSTVYAFEMVGKRYDIGDIESYKEVQETYKGIIK